MAQLKDLIVSGAARVIGTLYANVNGSITGTSTTQTAGDNSTKIATTQYVDRAVESAIQEIDTAVGNAINSSY